MRCVERGGSEGGHKSKCRGGACCLEELWTLVFTAINHHYQSSTTTTNHQTHHQHRNMGKGVKGAMGVARGLKDALLPEDVDAMSDSDSNSDDGARGRVDGGQLLFEDDTRAVAPLDAGRIFYKAAIRAGDYSYTAVSRVAHEIGGYCRWTRPAVAVLPTPIPHDASVHVTFFYATGAPGSPFAVRCA